MRRFPRFVIGELPRPSPAISRSRTARNLESFKRLYASRARHQRARIACRATASDVAFTSDRGGQMPCCTMEAAVSASRMADPAAGVENCRQPAEARVPLREQINGLPPR